VADIATQVTASLDALTREFDIIAHNMANVSTTGFKRRCNNFTKVLAAQQEGQAGGDEEGPQGVFDFSQGSLVQTDRTLDFALNGKGFFVIESPEGPLYTRHGIFLTNQNGQIVDAAGRLVAGMAGPLLVPVGADASQIHAGSDGRILAGQAAIGQFRVVEFAGKEDQLLPAGLNCFRAPQGIEPVDAPGAMVKQGYKEASNVKLVEELVNMIMVARLYEANMKLVGVMKDTTSSTIGVAMG
jgi:flagellar basal-body rod protein FlgF